MADQSIALDVKTPSFDASSPLLAAAQIGNQNAIGGYYSALSQIERQQAEGQNIAYRDELVRNAAAHAIDSDSWDTAMRDAAQRGAPEASQYIGRYTPLLQERLFGAYGGATGAPSGGAAAAGAAGPVGGTVGPPSAQYDRAFQNATPEQMGTSLSRLNMISDVLMGVRDQQSWNAAIARLQAAGIPQAGQFAGAYSPLQVQRLYGAIQPVRSYLQNRIAGSAAGLPNPMVPRNIEKTPEGIFEVDPYAAPGTPATSLATKKEFEGVDKTGTLSPGVFDPTSGTFTDAAGQPGASPFAALAAKINQAENATGNPGAKNPLSTATGNGQFINSTWLNVIKASRPDLVKGMTDQQILALRNDPKLSAEMTATYAQQNAATLSSAGLPVTSATLALAHRFGPDGAKSILAAPPGTKLSDVLPSAVMKANPSLAGVTAGQYAQTMVNQFGNAALETGTPPVNNDVHGDDYLKTLSPTMAAMVKSYAEGRQAFPSGYALKSPYFQNLIRMVGQYDPNFDAVNYNARAKTRSDFTSGKSAQTINAMNTALGHLSALDQAGDALNNSDYPLWNKIANWYGGETGKPAPKNFSAIAGLVAEELTRVYRGVGGAESDINRHLADLDVNASPEQRRGALYSISELLKSKLDAMGEQYNQGMGTTQDPLRLLNAPAQASFNRLLAYGPKGTGTPPITPGVAGTVVRPDRGFENGRTYQDQKGNKAVYQDGKWIPVGAS